MNRKLGQQHRAVALGCTPRAPDRPGRITDCSSPGIEGTLRTALPRQAPWLSVLLLVGCGGDGPNVNADASAKLARQGELRIETQPQSLLVKDGESAMFNVTGVIGGAHVPLRYQWRRNGVDLTGENKAYLLLGSVAPGDDQAEYSVVIGHGAGQQVTSAAGVLAVVPADSEMPWR